MIAKREIWNHDHATRVWAGKYRNSQNLLHWHYDCEFICVENGQIDVFCEGKTHTLSVGDSLFIDSEQVHYMHACAPDTVLIVIIFDYNIIKPYLGELRLVCPVLSGKYDIPSYYNKIRSFLLEKKPLFGAEAACSVLRLMIEVFRHEELCVRAETESFRSLKNLLEEVNKRYETFTFEEAVRFMNMSDAYFSRFFHKSTGITFSQYLNFVRTDNAVKLIQAGNNSITDVSERCGFGSLRTFNRNFKTLTGFTPRELPKNFILNDTLFYSSPESFNPTLNDCVLIESVES